MDDELFEILKRFTKAVGWKKPECWALVTYDSDEVDVYWDAVLKGGQVVKNSYFLTPTLSQFKQFIQWKGWWQYSGGADWTSDHDERALGEAYVCSIRRDAPDAEECDEPHFYGDSELKAAARAATHVAEKEGA